MILVFTIFVRIFAMGGSSCPSSTPPLPLSRAVHLRMGITSAPPYCLNLIVMYEYTHEQASLRSPVGRLL